MTWIKLLCLTVLTAMAVHICAQVPKGMGKIGSRAMLAEREKLK